MNTQLVKDLTLAMNMVAKVFDYSLLDTVVIQEPPRSLRPGSSQWTNQVYVIGSKLESINVA